jgi:hypothetical protein
MLSLLTQSISNASFGIYFPKFTGTIYELLSAPVSIEIVIAMSARRPPSRSARPDHPGDRGAVRAAASSIRCGCCCSWC